jgi:hypothetical protein
MKFSSAQYTHPQSFSQFLTLRPSLSSVHLTMCWHHVPETALSALKRFYTSYSFRNNNHGLKAFIYCEFSLKCFEWPVSGIWILALLGKRGALFLALFWARIQPHLPPAIRGKISESAKHINNTCLSYTCNTPIYLVRRSWLGASWKLSRRLF